MTPDQQKQVMHTAALILKERSQAAALLTLLQSTGYDFSSDPYPDYPVWIVKVFLPAAQYAIMDGEVRQEICEVLRQTINEVVPSIDVDVAVSRLLIVPQLVTSLPNRQEWISWAADESQVVHGELLDENPPEGNQPNDDDIPF